MIRLMVNLKNLSVAFVLVITGMPSAAQTCTSAEVTRCFSLRAPAHEIDAIVSAHDLIILDRLENREDIVLVASSTSVSPEAALSTVRGDGRVSSFERISQLILGEAQESSLIDGRNAQIESLGLQGEYEGEAASYFVEPVWEGYINQPAVEMLRIRETQSPGRPETFGFGTVAVIDTGVDPDHPVLLGSLVPGYDFILDERGIASEWGALDLSIRQSTQEDLEASADQSFASILEGGGATAVMSPSTQTVVDQSFASILESQSLPTAFGHGTLVAGLIRLVAPGSKIMPLRVFDGDGVATSWDMIQAIYYAADNGANVINMSFSTDRFSYELSQAIEYAESLGVVLVSSAGNSGAAALSWPSGFETVLGVASTDLNDHLSAFSNYGPHLVSLAAPGEELISTYPGGHYAIGWGTSFSAALVSGATTLLNDPSAGLVVDFEAAVDIYESSCEAIVQNQDAGWGRLDIYTAFEFGLVGH